MPGAIPLLRPYAFMPCTGIILCLYFINRLQTSHFAENWEKFGLNTFLNRFILEHWNHSYIHTVNVDVDSKLCTVVAKTVGAERRTDTTSLSVLLAQYAGRMQKNTKEKIQANSEPHTAITIPPPPPHIAYWQPVQHWAGLTNIREWGAVTCGIAYYSNSSQ